ARPRNEEGGARGARAATRPRPRAARTQQFPQSCSPGGGRAGAVEGRAIGWGRGLAAQREQSGRTAAAAWAPGRPRAAWRREPAPARLPAPAGNGPTSGRRCCCAPGTRRGAPALGCPPITGASAWSRSYCGWCARDGGRRRGRCCSTCASLKAVLAGNPPDNTVDLSGIPLTSRDLERVTNYLQRCGEQVDSVELGFTGLTDDMVLQLLPALSTLPRLTTLALNGNRLTRALLRDLTDTLKDPSKFPNVTWIDLGNNVDIFSLPQPFLLSLRKRSPKQGHLPTILELGEGPGSGEETREEIVGQEDPGGDPVSLAKDHHEGKDAVTQT
uniref:Leucine rich repeat containing 75A n=1 Tax=Sciurus vulgaris TaxID=55149 RepID=A0A8D2CTH7_SCIVU